MNKGAALKNSKSLYTNISLREISQSPDRAADQGNGGLNKRKSKKILITSDKLTNQ